MLLQALLLHLSTVGFPAAAPTEPSVVRPGLAKADEILLARRTEWLTAGVVEEYGTSRGDCLGSFLILPATAGQPCFTTVLLQVLVVIITQLFAVVVAVVLRRIGAVVDLDAWTDTCQVFDLPGQARDAVQEIVYSHRLSVDLRLDLPLLLVYLLRQGRQHVALLLQELASELRFLVHRGCQELFDLAELDVDVDVQSVLELGHHAHVGEVVGERHGGGIEATLHQGRHVRLDMGQQVALPPTIWRLGSTANGFHTELCCSCSHDCKRTDSLDIFNRCFNSILENFNNASSLP